MARKITTTLCMREAPPLIAIILAILPLAASRSLASSSGCEAELEGDRPAQQYHFDQRGVEARRVDLILPSAGEWLVSVREKNIDVEATIEIHSGSEGGSAREYPTTRFATPIERAGAMHALISARSSNSHAILIIAPREPTRAIGTLDVDVLPLPVAVEDAAAPPADERRSCATAMHHWARADSAFADGRAIELAGAGEHGDSSAKESAFEVAAEEYRAALDALARFPADKTAPTPKDGSLDLAQLQLTLAALGYYELYHWTDSAGWAAQAAGAFTRHREPYLWARAEAILAAAWLELGSVPSARAGATARPSVAIPDEYQARLARSRSLLRRLAAFHASRGESYDEALQINNLGLSYYYDGHHENAIPYFVRAQASFERLGDSARLAIALQNQALCEWGTGHLSSAVRIFERGLTVIHPSPRPNLYLLLLNNAGLAHYAAGEFDRALELEVQALDFANRTGSDRARARSYFGLGLAYYAIGDNDLAGRFLKSSLQYCPGELDLRTRVPALRSLAVIEDENRDFDAAIGHYREALDFARSPSARARLLVRLAHDYAELGDRERALGQLADIIEPGAVRDGVDYDRDPVTLAMALAERGRIYHIEQRLELARRDFDRALSIFRRYDSLAERFETEVELAHTSAEAGRPGLARAQIRDALRLSEEIRTQTANPEYRSSIAATLRPGVDFLITLLRAQFEYFTGRGDEDRAERIAAESLRIADESRARAFDDWRAERLGTPQGELAPALRRLLGTRAALYRDMAERRFQLAAREDHSGPEDPRVVALRADIAHLRARVGLIDAQLASATSGPGNSRRTAGGGASTPWQWRRALSELPSDRAFIEYRLVSLVSARTGESSASVPTAQPFAERGFAWVVKNGSVSWISLGPSADITRTAARFHDVMRLAGSPSERLQASVDLYRLAIAPLADRLAGRSNLVFIPDGCLHYISFAALKDPNQGSYLVQDHNIAIAPALRHLFISDSTGRAAPDSDTPPAEGRMLLVADPVYSERDPRIGTPAGRDSQPAASSEMGGPEAEMLRGAVDVAALARLPATAREAASISDLYGAGKVDLLIGLDATRDNVLARDLREYRIVHIASHGYVDSTVPQLSALVLGRFDSRGRTDDPYLRASDLLQRDFRAQAVIMTACDSSLGKAVAAEGIIGLRYAALARGARSVVASLWSITDGITQGVMTDMYRQMLLESSGAASAAPDAVARAATDTQAVVDALGTAMRRALAKAPSLDPVLWAPFAVYVAGR
jgi:CHAT domain-containing protein/tetratricopeptide (TPR) repeat protein